MKKFLLIRLQTDLALFDCLMLTRGRMYNFFSQTMQGVESQKGFDKKDSCSSFGTVEYCIIRAKVVDKIKPRKSIQNKKRQKNLSFTYSVIK